jgi:hypothetical protein
VTPLPTEETTPPVQKMYLVPMGGIVPQEGNGVNEFRERIGRGRIERLPHNYSPLASLKGRLPRGERGRMAASGLDVSSVKSGRA